MRSCAHAAASRGSLHVRACRHATRRGVVTDGACERCGVQAAGVVAYVGMLAPAMAKLSESTQANSIEAVEVVPFYSGMQIVITTAVARSSSSATRSSTYPTRSLMTDAT